MILTDLHLQFSISDVGAVFGPSKSPSNGRLVRIHATQPYFFTGECRAAELLALISSACNHLLMSSKSLFPVG
jgi:hypothetical protein